MGTGKKICELIEAPIFEGSPSVGLETSYCYIKSNMPLKPNLVFTDYTQKNEFVVIPCFSLAKNINPVMNKCENIRLDVLNSLHKNHFPIIIGGDHSVAMASIAAGSEIYGVDNYAVVYIDGHCDINTEKTSVTHNIHGMPLAASLGLCCNALQVGPLHKKIDGNNLFIIGARSIDDPERIIIKNNSVHLYENTDLLNGKLETILSDLKKKIGDKKVHLSFDVDVLDPSVLTSTGYVIKNGISLNTALQIIDFVFANFDVVSADVVEYNPTMDVNNKDINVVLEIINHIVNGVSLKNKNPS